VQNCDTVNMCLNKLPELTVEYMSVLPRNEYTGWRKSGLELGVWQVKLRFHTTLDWRTVICVSLDTFL
jgi:hypothetical protein